MSEYFLFVVVLCFIWLWKWNWKGLHSRCACWYLCMLLSRWQKTARWILSPFCLVKISAASGKLRKKTKGQSLNCWQETKTGLKHLKAWWFAQFQLINTAWRNHEWQVNAARPQKHRIQWRVLSIKRNSSDKPKPRHRASLCCMFERKNTLFDFDVVCDMLDALLWSWCKCFPHAKVIGKPNPSVSGRDHNVLRNSERKQRTWKPIQALWWKGKPYRCTKVQNSLLSGTCTVKSRWI